MTKQTLYKIIFRKDGKTMAIWDGYHSKSECRAALRDADLIIPFSWTPEIDSYQS